MPNGLIRDFAKNLSRLSGCMTAADMDSAKQVRNAVTKGTLYK